MSTYRMCGSSQRGKSHESSGTVCQDSCYYVERGGFVVAAVADGLGSSKHSDVASNIAARGAVEYCAGNIQKGMEEKEVLSLLWKSFDSVNFAIKQKAAGFLDDYDTTLTLAVYMDGIVYFGHAGDSGIIALRDDGAFEEITSPQLGEGLGKERPVYPLAAESHWVFGRYRRRARSLFLMTDGVLNKAVPPLLEDQEYKLDHAYLFYLYDNLCKNRDLDHWVNTELASILPNEINYDDKTLVAVMCDSVKQTLLPREYYEFPSKELWGSLLAKHNNELYGYKSSEAPTPIKNDPMQQRGGNKPLSSVPGYRNEQSSVMTRNDPMQPRGGIQQRSNAQGQSNVQGHNNAQGHSNTLGHSNEHSSVKKTKKTSRLRGYVIVFAVGFIIGVLCTAAFIYATTIAEEDHAIQTPPMESSLNDLAASPDVDDRSSPANALMGKVLIDNAEPRIGDALTGVLDGGNNTGTLTYTWKADGDVVGTENSYTVKLTDLDKRITLEITSSEETGAIESDETALVKKKESPEAPAPPTLDSRSADSVTLKATAGHEYSMDGINWQRENSFTGLSADTEYEFFQRIAETDDTEASGVSAELTVETDTITETR